MKIAVTGATGYIGLQLLLQLRERGHEPIALSRSSPDFKCIWQHYDLHLEKLDLPEGIDAIIHLAMNFNVISTEDVEREKQAAVRLLEFSREHNIKFLFVSSQTASDKAMTLYGKTKWEIEQLVIAADGNIARPGMVYGGQLKGLFGGITQALSRLAIAPRILPPPLVQPIHVNDLSVGLINIVEGHFASSRLFRLASDRAIPFHHFLQLIGKFRINKKITLLPVPRFIINLAYLVLPNNKQVLQFRSLINLPLMSTANDLRDLALSLRSVPDGLFHSGDFKKRQLLLEAYSLLTYLLAERPSLSLVKRYLKASRYLALSDPLYLPPAFYKFPVLLGFINIHAIKDRCWAHKFIARLDLATAVAEASTIGATKYLRIKKPTSFILAGLNIVRIVSNEIFQRIFSLILTPILLDGVSKKSNELYK